MHYFHFPTYTAVSDDTFQFKLVSLNKNKPQFILTQGYLYSITFIVIICDLFNLQIFLLLCRILQLNKKNLARLCCRRKKKSVNMFRLSCALWCKISAITSTFISIFII